MRGSKLLMPALVAVVLAAAPLRSQQQASVEAQIADAMRSDDYSQALQLLGPALLRFPRDAQLWTMKGVVYEHQGDKAEALVAFQRALEINPNAIPALQGAAQIDFDNANANAIPLLKRLLHLRPDDTTTHAMLAVLEYQQGNCSAALPHFEKAESVFQGQLEALHAFVICLVRAKQLEKATAILRHTAELTNHDAHEARLLASVELMNHKPDAALADLRSLLEPGTNDIETLRLAASAYEAQHDTEKAVDVLRHAILVHPDDADLYVQFADLSASHQSFQVGLGVVNDGLSVLPQAAPLYFARGMLYAQLAQYDKAQADFESAYQLDPKQSLSTAAQGLMAVQQNDLDRALKTVEQQLAQKPNDAVLLYLRADILSQQGVEAGSEKFQTAMHSARRAQTLDPRLAAAHSVLAKLYLRSGNYDKAIFECRKSLELNPKDQTSIYRLIQALRKGQKRDEIPVLLKRLAQLREEETREERERYRYKLIEETGSAR